MDRRRQGKLVAAGLVVAGAVGGVAGPAQAATPSPTRTVASTGTPNAVLGQVVSLKAAVKPVLGGGLQTGTVTFFDGGTSIGTATLALATSYEVGKITITTLAVGAHAISASYSGDANWAASTSLPITVTIAKDSSTVLVVPAAVVGVTGKYNLNVKVKVVKPGVGPATGVVTFVIDGGAGQAVAVGTGGRCHLAVTQLGVGTTHTVVVSYGGDARTAPSSGSVTFTA